MNDRAHELRVAARMAHIEPFEVMEIQSLARDLESRGADVIHLEIGEPDFRTPQPVVDAAKRALDNERMYYTSARGIEPLREAIAGFYRERHGLEVPASRIIVTAGSSAALLLAFGVLLDSGDEVLLADPSYPCNRHLMRTLGAVPRAVATSSRDRLPAHGGARARALEARDAHGDGGEPVESRPGPSSMPQRCARSPRSRAKRAARFSWTRSTTASPTGSIRRRRWRRARTSSW